MSSPSRDDAGNKPGPRVSDAPAPVEIDTLRLPVEGLEALAERSPVGIYVAQGGALRYVNPSLALAFQRSREQMQGQPLADLVEPQDRPALADHLEALASRRKSRFEMRTRASSGAEPAREARLVGVPTTWLGEPAVAGMWLELEAPSVGAGQLEEGDALARASSRLLGAENLEWLAREIVDSAVQDLRRACVSLFVVDERRSLVQLACSDPSMGSARPLFLSGPGITVAAAVSGETLNVPDVTVDPRYLPDAKAPGSELAIPLKASGRVVGVLNLESPEKNAFGERDVRILQTFAARAATAVENARLHERLRNRTKQLERFHELSLMMVGDHVAIHRAIVRQMAELLGTPYATLVRVEGSLIRSLAVVSPGNDPPGEACPIDVTPCRVVRDTRESCIFRSVAEFSDDPFLVPRAIKTFIGVPVFDRRGEVIGILNAMDRRERNFGAEELRILNLLARRAAEELEVERREREREETQQMLLQSEKMASLGQVVAGVAHELNNPLASVLGLAELLLRRGDLPEAVSASLGKIGAEAERARRVVGNLLAFARQHAPKRVPTDLNDVVSTALALRENEMRVSNIVVVRDLAGNVPPTLADAHLLQHAFLNFVLNAEHAMLEAHGRGRLTVRTRFLPGGGTRRPGPTVRVEFEDDGPGVAELNLSRIFEPFYTTKQVGEGTGLGLSLTHSIIEQHEGVVWVESRPGQGARFIVELPYASMATSQQAEAETQASAIAPSLAGRRILLADDEPALREIGREVLAAEGCVIEEAANGREALARIEAAEFDAVVSDVRMPDLGGFEVYRQGCALRPSLERRFLFVTGDVVSEDTVRFLEASGCASLAKPYNVDQFLLKVRELLET